MQVTQARTLADAVFPRVDSDNAALVWARDAALIIGFASLIALCAQIQVRLPWTTVPITAQTFGVLVAGGALGAWRGAGATLLYLLVGMFLLPVFTPATPVTSGSWDVHFILPWKGNEKLIWDLSSGGFIVGFVLAAALVGYLAERGWDRKQWVHLTMLAGNVLIYVPGLLWLAYLIGTDWVPPGGAKPISELISGSGTLDKTLKGGLYPFIVGDLMKLLLAATVLPGAWLLVDKFKGKRDSMDSNDVGRA
ncbi:MAG TPA: biotin transporter BioY [Dehalococcoidia bacterium]|nr:biotin transporter BioY [Dehalococcoidia bacterium]